MKNNLLIQAHEGTREFIVIDGEIKFLEITTEHDMFSDVNELAKSMGYGRMIMDHKKIKVIKKIKL